MSELEILLPDLLSELLGEFLELFPSLFEELDGVSPDDSDPIKVSGPLKVFSKFTREPEIRTKEIIDPKEAPELPRLEGFCNLSERFSFLFNYEHPHLT